MTKFKPFLFALCICLSKNLSASSGDLNLHWECFIQPAESFIALLEQHPSRRTDLNRWGQSFLHIACTHGNKALIEYLLPDTTHLRAADNQGKIPLHHACAHYNEDSVRLLIEKDPESIFVEDEDGLTPFHLATQRVQILKILLEKIDNNHDLIPRLIDYASSNNYNESRRALEFFQNPLPTN